MIIDHVVVARDIQVGQEILFDDGSRLQVVNTALTEVDDGMRDRFVMVKGMHVGPDGWLLFSGETTVIHMFPEEELVLVR